MNVYLPVLVLTALAWMPGGMVMAQQERAIDRIPLPEPSETRTCLPISQIRRIETVDDQTLLFHMRGSKKYVNHLPRTCHGLKRNSFIHRTPMNSYCNMDIITVIDMFTGMQFGSCPLGKFEEVMDASALE